MKRLCLRILMTCFKPSERENSAGVYVNSIEINSKFEKNAILYYNEIRSLGCTLIGLNSTTGI